MNPLDFETLAKSLVGATLARVTYFTLGYSPTADEDRHEPDWWDEAAGGECSMYGFDVITADNTTHAVLSESRWPFGLSIQRKSISESRPLAHAWDVSESSRWARLMGQKISAVNAASGEQITPGGYRRLNDQYLARRWWLRFLWPLMPRWWQPEMAIDWESLAAEEKVAVTSSVEIVTDGGHCVDAHPHGARVLITFPAATTGISA